MKNIFLIVTLILFSISSGCNSNTNSTSNAQNADNTSAHDKTKEKATEPLTEEKEKEPTVVFTDNKADYIPKGYYTLDKASGKLKDGTEIVVLVIGPESEKESYDSEENRTITILKKGPEEYEQMASNKELIMCKSCGGVFGDPYSGIELKDNVLSISNYGGSAWRWSESYIFRYQQADWQLIGATYNSYYNAKACNGEAGLAGRQLEDINFSTGKMHIIKTSGDNCDPDKDYMANFDKKTLIALNDFPGKPSQWPNGKIKDGDGE